MKALLTDNVYIFLEFSTRYKGQHSHGIRMRLFSPTIPFLTSKSNQYQKLHRNSLVNI